MKKRTIVRRMLNDKNLEFFKKSHKNKREKHDDGDSVLSMQLYSIFDDSLIFNVSIINFKKNLFGAWIGLKTLKMELKNFPPNFVAKYVRATFKD